MSTDEFVGWAILAALGGLVAVLKWAADRLHKRVDALEKGKVDKDAFKEAFQDLKQDLSKHREETTSALSGIQNTVNQILLRSVK